ncbi:MAG: hypothetical protein H0V00_11925 [Chloroflexia bacterium]|nr:hypothetical protein [Chloroflexia bacterium]
MHDQREARAGAESAAQPLVYPANRVSGAVPAAAVTAAVDELQAAGFAADAIFTLAGEEDAQRFRDLAGTPGIWGAVRRFALSLGADLDLARQAETELESGNALVEVTVAGDDEKDQVRDVLLRHGGHFITYFGPWTIETLA